MSLSYAERSVLRHTLGLNRSAEAFRNYFSAEDGHQDEPTLLALVERGYMVRETSAISPGAIYRCTKEGREALKDPTP